LAKRNIASTKKFLVVKLNAAARVSRARVGQKTQHRQGSD